jgi:hypothetical protein
MVITRVRCSHSLYISAGSAGADDIVHLCDRYKKRVSPWAHALAHQIFDISHPLQGYLANAIGVLIVASITWTLLLLKKRWFNSWIARSGVDAEGHEVRSH